MLETLFAIFLFVCALWLIAGLYITLVSTFAMTDDDETLVLRIWAWGWPLLVIPVTIGYVYRRRADIWSYLSFLMTDS